MKEVKEGISTFGGKEGWKEVKKGRKEEIEGRKKLKEVKEGTDVRRTLSSTFGGKEGSEEIEGR